MFACSASSGGADCGAGGGFSQEVETLNSLCGRIIDSPIHTYKK